MNTELLMHVSLMGFSFFSPTAPLLTRLAMNFTRKPVR